LTRHIKLSALANYQRPGPRLQLFIARLQLIGYVNNEQGLIYKH